MVILGICWKVYPIERTHIATVDDQPLVNGRGETSVSTRLTIPSTCVKRGAT